MQRHPMITFKPCRARTDFDIVTGQVEGKELDGIEQNARGLYTHHENAATSTKRTRRRPIDSILIWSNISGCMRQ